MKKIGNYVSLMLSILLCVANLQMTAAAEEEIVSDLSEEVIHEQYSDEETVQTESFDENSDLPDMDNELADSETEEVVPEDEVTIEEGESSLQSSGVWEYYHDNGTVIITGYHGADAEVVVPEEIDGLPVVYISSDIFQGNTYITSVTIPDCVEGDSLSLQLFMNCTNLETVVLPADTTIIQSNMFYGCTSLKRISGPEHVTTLGVNAFKDCRSLEDIGFFKDVTTTDTSAFSGCSSLTSVEIPAGLTVIKNGTFYNCTGLTEVIIPEGVTGIDATAFNSCTSLTSVKIPDSVTYIGDSAFGNCTSLVSINIPDGIKAIADQVFGGCKSLSEINIPESVTEIGNSAFSDCSSLTSVKIPDGVTRIGSSAFDGCKSLTGINIPAGVPEIGDSTFSNCSSLTTISLPGSVTSIGKNAFNQCSALHDIDLSEGLKTIGTNAFYKCTGLAEINIPDSVTTINQNAFHECTSLKNAKLSSSLEAINDNTFSDCSALTEVIVPASVRSIGNSAFAKCTNLTKVGLTEGLTSIGIRAFESCTSLNDIVLPDGLEEIENYQFTGCSSLKKINIPKSVQKIGQHAFSSCTALERVDFYGDAPKIVDSSFSTDVLTAYYPKGNKTWTESKRKQYGGTITWVERDDEQVIPIERIALNKSEITLNKGDTESLTVTYIPEDTTVDKTVTWTSSNEAVATVENGTVTAVGTGTAVITAKAAKGGVQAVCTVTVVIPVDGVKICRINESGEEEILTSADLYIGEERQFTAKVLPEDATNRKVIWNSSDEETVCIDENGNAKALKEGTAVITVVTEDGGYSAECTVTAYTVHAESISVDEAVSAERVEVGKTGTIKVVFEPANTTDQTLLWSSDNEEVAVVDETGTVTAVSEGTATITATSQDGGFTASQEITVYMIHVDSVSFRKDELTTAVGKSVKAEPVIVPANATMQDVTYTSDHPEIAEISEDGTITGVSVGTAVITAVTKDGNQTAVCSITVFPKDFTVREVKNSYPYTGTAIKPVPEVYDNGTLLTQGKDYTVSYKNNTAAKEVPEELDREHFVPVKAEGTDKYPYILVTGKGNYSGKVYIPFSITQIDLNNSDQVYIEESISLKANNKVQRPVPVITFNGKTVNAKEYTLTYLYNDDQDSEENILDKKTGPKEAGSYTILVTGSGKNFTGTKEIPLTISENAESAKEKTVALSKAITVSVPVQVYDGTEKKDVTIQNKAGYVLEENKDYTIGFTKNTNAGTATVTVTGKGIYTGTVKKTFKITPLPYAGNEGQFSIEVSDAVYSKGGAITEVHVFWNNQELKAGTDYTLKYTGNQKVGDNTASTKITFKGNYKGSASVPYSITPKDLSEVSITAKDLVYKKGKYKSTPVLTDSDGKKLKAGTDYDKVYEYTYSNGDPIEGDVPAGSEVTVTVHAKRNNYAGHTSYTYKILKAENNLSSAAVQFKDGDKTVKSITKEYTGEAVTLNKEDLAVTMKVKENGKTVTVTVESENYEIVGYTNNVNKGTAKVTIRGIGAFGGEKTVSFKIAQKTVREFHWTEIFSGF